MGLPGPVGQPGEDGDKGELVSLWLKQKTFVYVLLTV